LARGDLSKAKEHLAALEQICLIPCDQDAFPHSGARADVDEYDDLKRAIAQYSKLANR